MTTHERIVCDDGLVHVVAAVETQLIYGKLRCGENYSDAAKIWSLRLRLVRWSIDAPTCVRCVAARLT